MALSPAQRSAMVYVLDDEERESILERAIETAQAVEGVDLVLWLTGEGDAREAVVRSDRGELGFKAGAKLRGRAARLLGIEGQWDALGLSEA